MNKVMNYAKKNGKVTITEIHRELNITKSWVSDILNGIYGVLFDKLKFGYNTVYFILKSERNRFLQYYLVSNPDERVKSIFDNIKKKSSLKTASESALKFTNELSLKLLFGEEFSPPG